MLKTLEQYVLKTILSDDTFFIVMEVRTLFGAEYAKICLTQALRDIVSTIYRNHNLEHEYYRNGMSAQLEFWVRGIVLHQPFATIGKRTLYTFRHSCAKSAKRILFTAGDNIKNQLSEMPGVQMDIADIICNLIEVKGVHNMEPLVFSDGNRFANVFELKVPE